jgi:hypothetical protein
VEVRAVHRTRQIRRQAMLQRREVQHFEAELGSLRVGEPELYE